MNNESSIRNCNVLQIQNNKNKPHQNEPHLNEPHLTQSNWTNTCCGPHHNQLTSVQNQPNQSYNDVSNNQFCQSTKTMQTFPTRTGLQQKYNTNQSR